VSQCDCPTVNIARVQLTTTVQQTQSTESSGNVKRTTTLLPSLPPISLCGHPMTNLLMARNVQQCLLVMLTCVCQCHDFSDAAADDATAVNRFCMPSTEARRHSCCGRFILCFITTRDSTFVGRLPAALVCDCLVYVEQSLNLGRAQLVCFQ